MSVFDLKSLVQCISLSERFGVPIEMSDDVAQSMRNTFVERILWGKIVKRIFFARGVAKKLRCALNALQRKASGVKQAGDSPPQA